MYFYPQTKPSCHPLKLTFPSLFQKFVQFIHRPSQFIALGLRVVSSTLQVNHKVTTSQESHGRMLMCVVEFLPCIDWRVLCEHSIHCGISLPYWLAVLWPKIRQKYNYINVYTSKYSLNYLRYLCIIKRESPFCKGNN